MAIQEQTQDIDIFPEKTQANCKNILDALKELGFEMDKQLEEAIASGKDFIQIRSGPITLDLVFAPGGIESFSRAEMGKVLIDGKFPCA